MREKYKADKFCSFHFTVSAMQDLIRLNKGCNETACFRETAGRHFPVLLLSGAEDPVGGDGKGVTAVYDRLRAAGADVTVHLYPNCRHELLQDDSFEDVTAEILAFLAS